MSASEFFLFIYLFLVKITVMKVWREKKTHKKCAHKKGKNIKNQKHEIPLKG